MNTNRKLFLATAFAAIASLSACGGGGGDTVSPAPSPSPAPAGGTGLVTTVPTPTYAGDKLAVFNRLNADRELCGFGKVAQNAKLDLAAQGHAEYLRLNGTSDGHNQRSTSVGFTGVTLNDRVAAAGYTHWGVSEGIGGALTGTGPYNGSASRPYRYSETDIPLTHDLKSLYTAPYHLASMVSGYREIGIGAAVRTNIAGNEVTNSRSLVMDYGIPTGEQQQLPVQETVLTFPCQGMEGLNPFFLLEEPDPFPNTNRLTNPYGQPVYIYVRPGQTLNMTAGSITEVGGGSVAARWLHAGNDPHAKLQPNQWFLAPTTYLKDNTFYDVVLTGTNSGLILPCTNSNGQPVTPCNSTGSFTKSFRFKTGTFTGG